MLHSFLLSYLLSNAALYLVDEELFSSSYFYAPLVLFDTVFLTAAISFSGQLQTDFYLAFFLTIVLCGLCKDFRGPILISLLGPLIYGYLYFKTTEIVDTGVYLRLPFPFVIAIFYGYFVQLENAKRELKEKEEEVARHRRTEAEIQRHLRRITALHEINLAATSTLDLRAILSLLLEKIDQLLPVSAVITIRLLKDDTGFLEAVAVRNITDEEWRGGIPEGGRGLSGAVWGMKVPVMVVNALDDPRTRYPEFLRRHGLVSYLGLPLMTKGEVIGDVSLFTKAEYPFTTEEIEILSTIAGQAAIAIHNAQLYEDMKKQAVELESTNRVKSEFLSVMSHELRTPLNVIMGYTGMIREGMCGEINDKQVTALGKVLDHSNRLLDLITNILQATTFEAEIVSLAAGKVNLNDFLAQLSLAFHAPAGKELELIWEHPSDLPTITTDREKLRHILKHLIDNAIKFTEKGRVTISVRYFPREGIVELKVADTGIGISGEMVPVIFERFRQVDSSETRAYGGIGLGLHIVKKFTELLGGKIEVESELGKGSIFTVTLPC